MEKMFLVVLFALSTTVQGLEIQLGNANLSLTRDASCCGPPAAQRSDSQCRCDTFCSVYGDCCLDYPLFRTDADTNATVSGASANCTEAWRSGNLTSREGGMTGEGCKVWESDEAGIVNEVVLEYQCLLKALWEPVILRRSTTRRFVSAPARVTKKQYRVRLLQDCGPDASAEDDEACLRDRSIGSIQDLHDVISLLPVTARDGLHYKNLYCARCHGYDSRDVIFWSLRLYCRPHDLDVTAFFSTNISVVADNCLISHIDKPTEIPWDHAETRLPAVVLFRCDDSPENAYNAAACHAYSLPTNDYPNPHCKMCIGTNGTAGNGTISDSNGHEMKCNDWLCNGMVRPLSVLFDFSPTTGTSLSLHGQSPTFIVPDCEHGQVYDTSTGSCRPFYCPSGQTVADDGLTCASLGNQTTQCTSRAEIMGEDEVVILEVSLASEVSKHDSRWSVIVKHLRQILDDQIKEYNMQVDSYSRPTSDHNCSLVTPYAYTLIFTSHTPNTTIKSLAQSTAEALGDQCWTISNLTFAILELTLKNFERGILTNNCAKRGQETEERPLENFTELTVDNVPYIKIMTGSNETMTCPSLDTCQDLTVGREFQMKQSVFSCITKLYCPIFVLNSSEVSRVTDNGTTFAVHEATGRNFSVDDFIEMTGGDIAVCRFPLPTDSPIDHPDPRPTEILFSLVGITVSEVFLLLSLLNYYMFPELRKLPGKNMISFIVATFSLQMIFLLGRGSPLSQYTLTSEASCFAFAVLTHYLLLAVFVWSNVVSLHFVRTFGGRLRPTAAESSRQQRRTFLFYSLYGWGAPAVLVGASCAVHFTADINGLLENVYGNDCLIYGGILYFFAIPAAVLMGLNVMFFVWTVVGIKRTRRAASFARREKGRLEMIKMDFNLCIKISVATGMLWLVVFVLGSLQIQGLSYLIIIDFTLQGPLVFFAFAFTGRVRGLWRKKLGSSATKRSLQRDSQDRTTGSSSGGTSSSLEGLVRSNADTIRFSQSESVSKVESTFINPLYDMVDKREFNDSKCNMIL
ncbi:uncharacterized protein LOC119740353 [Patiria miniata]|uniref:G-protein coupled receptors family 2 profile 2 domain-containing protein n=1 Tax=Patiria miniata TaxID=46514 RepID=A0A914B610_PATMI|nr:uncharacterized protein LOC119740353 [Patiria miniata]